MLNLCAILPGAQGCVLSEVNLHPNPQSGQCTKLKGVLNDECEMRCAPGYALGLDISSNDKHILKCVGTSLADAAWKQRDDTSALPPSCKSKCLKDIRSDARK